MQESTSHAWFTQVQEDSIELEGFKLDVGDNTQVKQEPAAAQPEERAAGYVQAQETPGIGTQDDPADVRVQVEDSAGVTQHVAITNAFHVEKVNSLPVGRTAVFIDSAAPCHMVSADSRISKHVVETSDCNVRIKGSCGTSSATKKATIKFGIGHAQDKIICIALDVKLVRDLGATIFSFGVLTEKGGKCDRLSTLPVFRHGMNYTSKYSSFDRTVADGRCHHYLG